MPIRSVRGFLLNVLAVCAAVWVGLALLHLRDPDLGVDALFGMPLAVSVGALGVLAWGLLAVAEAVGGRWAVAAVLALGLLVAPQVAEQAEVRFWEGRTDGVGWAGSAVAWRTSAVGHVRGSLGFACSGAYAVRLRLDDRGRGVGRAEWIDLGPLYTLLFALSPLDGPGSFPIRGELVGERLEITAIEGQRGARWTTWLPIE